MLTPWKVHSVTLLDPPACKANGTTSEQTRPRSATGETACYLREGAGPLSPSGRPAGLDEVSENPGTKDNFVQMSRSERREGEGETKRRRIPNKRKRELVASFNAKTRAES